MNPSQYTEDYPPENWRWARVVQMFTARDISRAETWLLHVLGWDLSVTERGVREQMSCVSFVAGHLLN